MTEPLPLSEPALALFREHVERGGDVAIDDSNRAVVSRAGAGWADDRRALLFRRAGVVLCVDGDGEPLRPRPRAG